MRALALGCALLVLSTTAAADYSGRPRAWQLLQNLKADYDFSDEEIRDVQQALVVAQRVPQLVEFEQKAKEKTLDWPSYRAIHINDANLQRGLDFLRTHADTFARAESEFG